MGMDVTEACRNVLLSVVSTVHLSLCVKVVFNVSLGDL